MGENSPSNYNNENNTSHNVLNQAEQEALDFYFEGGNRKSKRGYQGPERRSPSSQLDRIMPQLIGMKNTSSGNSERDVALREFQDWFPGSLQEANTVVDGVMKRVNNAANTHSGSADSAVAERYYTFSGYLLDSAEDMHVLNNGITSPKDDISQPDAERIRTSHQVLEVIAKQLLAREFLWNNHWPSKHTNSYKDRFKYWRGFTLAASKFASDESVIMLFDFAKSSNAKRFEFWMREQNIIDEMPIVKDLKAQGKIIPYSFNNLLHRKTRELNTHDQQLTLDEAPKELEAPTDFYSMIPEEVRRKIEEQKRREEAAIEAANAVYDREYDKLESIFSGQQVREKLAQRGIGRASLATEIKDHEEADELRAIDESANKTSKPSKKRRRFKRRGRESGPSDKRVEKDYWKPY
jgi:hypothetical protein